MYLTLKALDIWQLRHRLGRRLLGGRAHLHTEASVSPLGAEVFVFKRSLWRTAAITVVVARGPR